MFNDLVANANELLGSSKNLLITVREGLAMIKH